MVAKGSRWKRIVARIALVILAVVLVAAPVAYKAYEPVFSNLWGWKPVPAKLDYPIAAMHAPGWEAAGAKADELLKIIRERTLAPSVSAAILVDGEVIWAGVVGYADLDALTPATLQTAYRIGSSSKAVTSVAMGILVDQGKVDLDVPVSTYVKDLEGVLAPVTTRQAMSHTAGVRDYGACLCFPVIEYFNRRHFDTQREALRPIEHSKLLFAPGTGFSYTSLGYNLSGAVIEGVMGERFSKFLSARVFTPLGMSSSRADTGTPIAREAQFYDVVNGHYKPVFRVDNTVKLPSGGILATPSDLVRLGQQMIRPTLFGTATRDLLATPTKLKDGGVNRQNYALGWRSHEMKVRKEMQTTRVLHHHGTALGSISHFAVYPEEGVAVSLMMNLNQARFGPAADYLVDIFLEERDTKRAGSGSVETRAGSPAKP